MTKGQDKSPPALALMAGPGVPLNAAADWIASHDHLEQEFWLSGAASRYRMSAADADAVLIDAGHPYQTRLLVRRPRDPAKFNGTVIVEWLNVSTGQDIDFVYAATRELILREGYAWVGASVQRVGVERLMAWNPTRYAVVGGRAHERPRHGQSAGPCPCLHRRGRW